MDCFEEIQRQCRQNPHKIALTEAEASKRSNELSYEELASKITLVRTALINLDVKAGDTVLIVYPHCPQVLILLLACISLGLQTVPINPSTNIGKIKGLINDLKPFLILTDKQEPFSIKKAPYEELLMLGKRSKLTKPFSIVDSSDKPILLMQTSGSNGEPKKILYNYTQLNTFMQKHDFLYRQFSDKAKAHVYESDLISTLLCSHFAGFCLCLQGLMMGRTVHLLLNYTPQEYWALAVKEKVALLMMVPSMYEYLVDSFGETVGKHSVRFGIALGEPCSQSLANRLSEKLQVSLYSTYGLSECQTGIGHEQPLIDKGNIPTGSCGRQLFGEIRLMNEQNEQSNEGELWVRNETTFPCYSEHDLNHQALNKGWFRTGDLLKRDKQGNFYYLGRKDSLFIVNGKNIYPVEVEATFEAHCHVVSCVVVPIVSATGKTLPGVLIMLAKGRHVTKAALIDFYLLEGDVNATPRWVCFVEGLPVNNTGKLDRLQCQDLLQREYEQHCYQLAS